MNENLKFLKEVFESKNLPEESLPEFVFWGRSNVGKSSLINSITKSKIAKTSLIQIAANLEIEFHKAKLTTGRFYMKRSLPETSLRLNRILSGKDPVMDLDKNFF